jgi:hypothetical protein
MGEDEGEEGNKEEYVTERYEEEDSQIQGREFWVYHFLLFSSR